MSFYQLNYARSKENMRNQNIFFLNKRSGNDRKMMKIKETRLHVILSISPKKIDRITTSDSQPQPDPYYEVQPY